MQFHNKDAQSNTLRVLSGPLSGIQQKEEICPVLRIIKERMPGDVAPRLSFGTDEFMGRRDRICITGDVK